MKRFVLVLLALFLFGPVTAEASDPAVEVARILDGWTSFRWGQDCLVWVVHYPEELVDPWVRVDGARQGLTPHEMETSAQAFRKSLRMAEAEAFLVSVYNFGGRPLSLKPVERRLMLELADGRRVAPLSFEERLGEPISGLVQGLVFFPRQEGPFSFLVSGLGPGPETRFTFVGTGLADGPVEEVLVELPPVERPSREEPEPPSVPQSPVVPPPVSTPEGPSAPEPASPDFAPPPPFLLLPSDPLPVRPVSPPAPEVAVPAAETPPSAAEELSISAENGRLLPETREDFLERFLALWSEGRTEELYGMVSDETKSRLSPEDFRQEALNRTFRLNLRDGYRTTWLDGDRVKVTAAQKLVFIRVLQSEVLSLVRQEGGWRVVW
ncbi:MAG: hypothetical protein JMJ93_06950 [Synergistaceae bacterium]|nr:hypothetical protein [Synergistaceae bacterium]